MLVFVGRHWKQVKRQSDRQTDRVIYIYIHIDQNEVNLQRIQVSFALVAFGRLRDASGDRVFDVTHTHTQA